jgi:hypothetical protein
MGEEGKRYRLRRVSSAGIALRYLCGSDSRTGDGPIEVLTRVADFNVVEVAGPNGPMPAPANSLVAFTAQRFEELFGSDGERGDVWKFRVMAQGPGGAVIGMDMFLAGADIFVVRAPGKVI